MYEMGFRQFVAKQQFVAVSHLGWFLTDAIEASFSA